MQLLRLLAACGLASAAAVGRSVAPGPVEAHKKHYLKTQVKPGQSAARAKFHNLYLEAYHTGAGFNDAPFGLAGNTTYAAKGYFNNTQHAHTLTYYNQLFDVQGGTYGLIMDEFQVQYTDWQPVRINSVGRANNATDATGFYNTTEGLKWTSTPNTPGQAGRDAFAGWSVCDWWHAVPQLFFRIYQNETVLPSSCADINLVFEYVK